MRRARDLVRVVPDVGLCVAGLAVQDDATLGVVRAVSPVLPAKEPGDGRREPEQGPHPGLRIA